jgi:hypothetical protein
LVLDDGAKTVQRHIPEMPLIDPDDFDAVAMSMIWLRFELARAGVVAVAIAELDAFDIPVGHIRLPSARRTIG